jgi:hypothetical protein
MRNEAEESPLTSSCCAEYGVADTTARSLREVEKLLATAGASAQELLPACAEAPHNGDLSSVLAQLDARSEDDA